MVFINISKCWTFVWYVFAVCQSSSKKPSAWFRRCFFLSVTLFATMYFVCLFVCSMYVCIRDGVMLSPSGVLGESFVVSFALVHVYARSAMRYPSILRAGLSSRHLPGGINRLTPSTHNDPWNRSAPPPPPPGIFMFARLRHVRACASSSRTPHLHARFQTRLAC